MSIPDLARGKYVRNDSCNIIITIPTALGEEQEEPHWQTQWVGGRGSMSHSTNPTSPFQCPG